MKKNWCICIIMLLIAASSSIQQALAQESFATLLDKARHGEGAVYLKLADCYRTGTGVKRDLINMITMAEKAEEFGFHINDYINGLPDDDEYKTLFILMDRQNDSEGDKSKGIVQKFIDKGSLEAQTLLGIITVEQGDTTAGMKLIRNAAEQECSIAELILAVPNPKIGQQADTLKLLSMANRVPMIYSLLGDLYYQPNKGGKCDKPLATKYYLEAEKHAVLPKYAAKRLLYYHQNGGNIQLTEEDVKRLELIVAPEHTMGEKTEIE